MKWNWSFEWRRKRVKRNAVWINLLFGIKANSGAEWENEIKPPQFKRINNLNLAAFIQINLIKSSNFSSFQSSWLNLALVWICLSRNPLHNPWFQPNSNQTSQINAAFFTAIIKISQIKINERRERGKIGANWNSASFQFPGKR